MYKSNTDTPEYYRKENASMGKMTVYHGSYTTVRNPGIIKGRNTKDFGPGFYCTIIREQAERWARRYDKKIVNTYTVRMDTGLKILFRCSPQMPRICIK